MICKKCQKEINDNSAYCCYCGTSQGLICPTCGIKMPDDASFCSKCGNSLTGIFGSDISVGDYIQFGNYWQDSYEKKDPIEWRVLDKVGKKKVLLLSKFALDNVNYHKSNEGCSWENSYIREWLNTEFLSNAFSSDEQNQIILSDVINVQNSIHGFIGGNNTKDKLFILNNEEIEKYLDDIIRRCMPTKYAIWQKVLYDDRFPIPLAIWRTRSVRDYRNIPSAVSAEGIICNDISANMKNIAVRVALWLDLEHKY